MERTPLNRQLGWHCMQDLWQHRIAVKQNLAGCVVDNSITGSGNRPISQIPQSISITELSHNASFCKRNVTSCPHFCYKMLLVGYGTGAVWDSSDRSITCRLVETKLLSESVLTHSQLDPDEINADDILFKIQQFSFTQMYENIFKLSAILPRS